MLELSAPCYYLQILFHDCLRKFRILCEHRDEATMRSEFIVPITSKIVKLYTNKGKNDFINNRDELFNDNFLFQILVIVAPSRCGSLEINLVQL